MSWDNKPRRVPQIIVRQVKKILLGNRYFGEGPDDVHLVRVVGSVEGECDVDVVVVGDLDVASIPESIDKQFIGPTNAFTINNL